MPTFFEKPGIEAIWVRVFVHWHLIDDLVYFCVGEGFHQVIQIKRGEGKFIQVKVDYRVLRLPHSCLESVP
jgi:hypothetical protein